MFVINYFASSRMSANRMIFQCTSLNWSVTYSRILGDVWILFYFLHFWDIANLCINCGPLCTVLCVHQVQIHFYDHIWKSESVTAIWSLLGKAMAGIYQDISSRKINLQVLLQLNFSSLFGFQDWQNYLYMGDCHVYHPTTLLRHNKHIENW